MTAIATQLEAGSPRRTSGFLRPAAERAVRAAAAMDEGRLRDAESNLDAMPNARPEDRVWKLILTGDLALQTGNCTGAIALFEQAVGAALLHALLPPKDGEAERSTPTSELGAGAEPTEGMPDWPIRDVHFARLAAMAMDRLGTAQRRLDDPRNAESSHRVAYGLRSAWGSGEELWETASNLGLDADLAGRFLDAVQWHQKAIAHSEDVAQGANEKKATAWQRLSASWASAGKLDEAVHAAQRARDEWYRHDPGTISAAHADQALGHVLLKQSEAILEVQSVAAAAVLDEAVKYLAVAHEGLSAFGPPGLADAQLCIELKDFAERLRSTIPTRGE